MSDMVNSAPHYTVYPVQPIEIARHLGFCLGNAVKYVLRAPFKGEVEDCDKALKYLAWEEERPQAPMTVQAFAALEHDITRLRDALVLWESDPLVEDDITSGQSEFLMLLEIYFGHEEGIDATGALSQMCGSVRLLRRSLQLRAVLAAQRNQGA